MSARKTNAILGACSMLQQKHTKRGKKEAIILLCFEMIPCGQPVDKEMQEGAGVGSFRNLGTRGICLALARVMRGLEGNEYLVCYVDLMAPADRTRNSI